MLVSFSFFIRKSIFVYLIQWISLLSMQILIKNGVFTMKNYTNDNTARRYPAQAGEKC